MYWIDIYISIIPIAVFAGNPVNKAVSRRLLVPGACIATMPKGSFGTTEPNGVGYGYKLFKRYILWGLWLI